MSANKTESDPASVELTFEAGSVMGSKELTPGSEGVTSRGLPLALSSPVFLSTAWLRTYRHVMNSVVF